MVGHGEGDDFASGKVKEFCGSGDGRRRKRREGPEVRHGDFSGGVDVDGIRAVGGRMRVGNHHASPV